LLLLLIIDYKTNGNIKIKEEEFKQESSVCRFQFINNFHRMNSMVIIDGFVKRPEAVILNEVRVKNLSQLSTRFFPVGTSLPQNDPDVSGGLLVNFHGAIQAISMNCVRLL